MFILFLALAILGVLALAAGLAWLLIGSGQTRRRSGREAGAEVMGAVMEADEEETDGVSILIAGGQVFRGTGTIVEKEAEVGYGQLKADLRQKRWREALPPLLIMAGMTVFCLFGSLALFVRWEEKLIGALLAAVIWYTLARIWIGFARA